MAFNLFSLKKNGMIFILLFGSFVYSFAQEKILRFTFTDSLIVYAEREAKIARYSSVATKSSTPLFRSPVRVGVVTQAIIQSQHGISLRDALQNISGINPQAGLGIYDYFIIRGFNSLDNGLILYDGIIEPEATIYNLYNIDRVEVLKGPGTFLYGGSPLSGTINLRRKQPVFRNFASFILSGGSFKSYRGTLDAGISIPERGIAGRINSVWQTSDLYRNDKENEVLAINPAFTWKINDSNQLNVNVEYFSTQSKPDAGLPLLFDPATNEFNKIADVPRDISYQTPFDHSEQKLYRTHIQFSSRIHPRLGFQNNFYYTDLDWLSTGTILNGAVQTPYLTYAVLRSLQRLDYHQKFIGNQFEIRYSFQTGKIDHEIITGLEINRLNDLFSIDVIPQITPVDLNNPVETFSQSSTPFYPYQRGDAYNTVVAPYFLDILSVGQTLKLFLGSRYDWISFKDDKNNTEREYTKLSPMVGINYRIVANLALFANSGKAFAPPSSRAVGNPKAEESLQIEFGIKKNWLDGKIKATMSVYQLNKENMVIPDRSGLSKQTGSQQSRGVEIEFTGQMTNKCASLFSYTYTDSKLTEFSQLVNVGMDSVGNPMVVYVDRTNNTGAFVPKHIINFWHTREIGSHLAIGFGCRYVSEQFINEDNIFSIEDYFTLDAGVFYTIRNLRWSLNFKNLTDATYEMRGFGASSVIPAAPFAVYGGCEFHY